MTGRIKLKDRLLPDYTRGEEIMNMVSHIVGGALGIVVFLQCMMKSIRFSDTTALFIFSSAARIRLYCSSRLCRFIRHLVGGFWLHNGRWQFWQLPSLPLTLRNTMYSP